MSDKPLDCVGISAEVGNPTTGKHDFKAHSKPDMVKEFERIMTETTGCKFVDCTNNRENEK